LRAGPLEPWLRIKQYLPSSPSREDLEFIGAQTLPDCVDPNAHDIYSDILKQGDKVTKLLSKELLSAVGIENDSFWTEVLAKHYKNAPLSQPRECLPSELHEPPIEHQTASDSIKLTHYTFEMFLVRWFCVSDRDVATGNLHDAAPWVPSTYPHVLAQSLDERRKWDQRIAKITIKATQYAIIMRLDRNRDAATATI
jgi:hypothetical protein